MSGTNNFKLKIAMHHMHHKLRLSVLAALMLSSGLMGVPFVAEAAPKSRSNQAPALVITNQPVPQDITQQIYNRPTRAPGLTGQDVLSDAYFSGPNTIVSEKIESLRRDLFKLQGDVSDAAARLSSIQSDSQRKAADYYAAVATISTQLQSGTTPGNPRLVQRMANAQDSLESLSQNINSLNDLAVEAGDTSATTSFLLQSAQAAYGLTGAVEEDHARLAQIEDAITNTSTVIQRVQNNINDDITRTAAYLASERSNLRTLSLAVTNADFYGKSLANRPFANVPQFSSYQTASLTSASNAGAAPVGVEPQQVSAPGGVDPAPIGSARPLMRIKFNKANVNYQEPVYMTMNDAMEKYPAARFEVVAVYPENGNKAQQAIESNRSRRHAENVLRTLNEMGLSPDRVVMSYLPSAEADSSEVHIYMR